MPRVLAHGLLTSEYAAQDQRRDSVKSSGIRAQVRF
jgi:hypothetical protein